ncbi:MAG: hydrogenase nickel incorporation protein HypB [Phaeodactylibacter sp.]|nr:hydrogenase nickel incorporation protein HypB [Phaeodactylibacter sp.]MCB9264167.1 hydrogenase nickel incorporation protein HypB [Lewinellaceae bacterium]MCB9286787.1 hydrogenase nickel incorporation protein HypB [Lewinellaceae bacterium]
MCSTCGCNQPSDAVTITLIGEEEHGHEHTHEHSHGHHHHHEHEHGHHHHTHAHSHDGHHHHSHHEHEHGHTHGKTVIELEQDILQQNNLLAERNRGFLEAKDILALNLVSSPGSGKTSLLERTLQDLGGEFRCYVIEGDQQTSNDANRIAATGAPVVQINTGKGCHLDSDMVNNALKKLKPENGGLLFIENVGNLVCPSLFDLGEGARVVIISVTEGDDKPIKYPDMFYSSDLCIINKVDLLPYVQFDVEQAREYARRVNHHLEFIELSATSGEGMEQWYEWLRQKASP